jgi:hypothetical protein
MSKNPVSTRRTTASSIDASAPLGDAAARVEGVDRGRQPSAAPDPKPSTADSLHPRPRWDRMTDAEKDAYVAQRVARSRVAQGLPEKIEDPAFYAFMARILKPQPARTTKRGHAA